MQLRAALLAVCRARILKATIFPWKIRPIVTLVADTYVRIGARFWHRDILISVIRAQKDAVHLKLLARE